MGRRELENPSLMRGWRHWTKFLGAAALLSALAALAIPGPSGEVTGIASVLAVGAIAVLAEHAWGLLLIGLADVLLVGKVWPTVAFHGHDDWATGASTIALIAALPGLIVFASTLGRSVEMILGERGTRLASAGVALSAASAVVWLVVPAFSA
jgi:hypothetical protein